MSGWRADLAGTTCSRLNLSADENVVCSAAPKSVLSFSSRPVLYSVCNVDCLLHLCLQRVYDCAVNELSKSASTAQFQKARAGVESASEAWLRQMLQDVGWVPHMSPAAAREGCVMRRQLST